MGRAIGTVDKLTEKQEEILGDIHHQAAETQRMVVNCLANQRVGKTWLETMKHNHERQSLLLARLENKDVSKP